MGDKQNLAKESQLALKQDLLIAGSNITIAADGKTISAATPTSVTVTPIYQAGTLVAAIVVNGNTTNIYAPQQHGDNANQNLAAPFSASSTYAVDDYVIYQENLYQCITAINTPAAWDSTKWARVLITDVMGQGGGGLDLPDNWSLDKEALTVMALDNDLNELGWKVEDDTYYFDTAASFSLGNREYTKDNAKPALGGVIGQPGDGQDKSIVLTSTDASATHFSWNSTTYSFTYLGTTWYYCGGNYAFWGAPASGIEIIPDETLTLEQAAKYLIDYSQVSFTDDRFTTMSQPASGYLFAGGGEETDLSDATFKAETDGTVHGTDFKVNNTSILNAFTGSDGTNAGVKGMVPAPAATDNTKFLRGDGTWANAGGGGGGGGSYSETTLWNGNETPTTSGMNITLSGNISDYDLLVIYTYDPNNNYGGDNFYLVNDLTIGDIYISTVYAGNSLGAYWTYTSDTSINIKRQASAWPVTYTSVKGIKFGGGSGNNHTYSTAEHTIGTWTDGSTLYEKTYEIDVLSPASTYTQNISIPNMNIIEIVKHYANYLYNGTWYYLSGDSLYYNNSEYLHLQYDGELQGTLALSAHLGAVSEIKLCFTLRYTKSSSS